MVVKGYNSWEVTVAKIVGRPTLQSAGAYGKDFKLGDNNGIYSEMRNINS